MSTISAFQPLTSPIYTTNSSQVSPKSRSLVRINFHRNAICSQNLAHLRVTHNHNSRLTKVRSSGADAQIPESVVEPEPATEQTETVAVPVSPADKLIMFFQAEGMMNELAIPKVTEALQGTEGISDLKVHISEGIASVELMKQTTIQATGVASGLLETIQGAGFKLNALNLSFEDEELLTNVN